MFLMIIATRITKSKKELDFPGIRYRHSCRRKVKMKIKTQVITNPSNKKVSIYFRHQIEI